MPNLDPSHYTISLIPAMARMVLVALASFTGDGMCPSTVQGADDGSHLIVTVTKPVLSAALTQVIDRADPVRECLLGARITGIGRTKATVTVELVPCERAAIFDLVFKGTTASDTVAASGPARVSTSNKAAFTAQKRIVLDDRSLQVSPATVRATDDSVLTGIGTDRPRLIGPLVRRIAARSYERDKAKAAKAGTDLTELRLREQFDAGVADALPGAGVGPASPLTDLFQTLGLDLATVTLRTTADAIEASARVGSEPSRVTPPPAPTGAGVVIRVHESFVAATTAASLGKKLVSPDRLYTELESLFGPPTPSDETPEVVEILARFAASPATVEFSDGTIKLTIRMESFRIAGMDYPGMDVMVRYKIIGTRLVREGDSVVQPPGYSPKDRLTASQLAVRALLRRLVLPDLFPAKVNFPPIALPSGKDELQVTHLSATSGWLVVGVQVVPTVKQVAEVRGNGRGETDHGRGKQLFRSIR